MRDVIFSQRADFKGFMMSLAQIYCLEPVFKGNSGQCAGTACAKALGWERHLVQTEECAERGQGR